MAFVRLPGLVCMVLVAGAGCIGLPSHEDRTTFHAVGSYEAAIEAGADVLHAQEDPGDRGTYFPSIPMSHPELDAAWGEGRYALTSVHWWGPPGVPEPDPDVTHVIVGPTWQGFILARGQVQATLGDVPESTARAWYDDFLQNVTTLDSMGRQAAVEALFADCDLACTGPEPPGLDAAHAWQQTGGLEVATTERLQPSSGRLVAGAWWFWFEWDEATLESLLPGGTTLRVGANDVVEFVWQSGRSHSDEASYEKLVAAVGDVGITPPPAEGLSWVHQEIHYD